MKLIDWFCDLMILVYSVFKHPLKWLYVFYLVEHHAAEIKRLINCLDELEMLIAEREEHKENKTRTMHSPKK